LRHQPLGDRRRASRRRARRRALGLQRGSGHRRHLRLLEAAVSLGRELASTLGRSPADVTRTAALVSGTQTLADGRAVALIRDGAGRSHCSRNAAAESPTSVQR
jgi:hypothetical protein